MALTIVAADGALGWRDERHTRKSASEPSLAREPLGFVCDIVLALPFR